MKPPNVPCPPRNPHCHGVIDSVPIEQFITVFLIIAVVYGFFIITCIRMAFFIIFGFYNGM